MLKRHNFAEILSDARAFVPRYKSFLAFIELLASRFPL